MLYTMREELKKEVRQLIPALQSLDPQLRNRLEKRQVPFLPCVFLSLSAKPVAACRALRPSWPGLAVVASLFLPGVRLSWF